jgi:murein DD-endopeptidase MepM/ murein hydrolase activator NlpD
MLRFFIILLFYNSLFGAIVTQYHWKKNRSYLVFLEEHSLPLKPLYYNIDPDDKSLTKEIFTGVPYQILTTDDKKHIQQILIPLTNELQIHIYKDKKSHYQFETIPIKSIIKKEAFYSQIISSPGYTIFKKTGSRRLAREFESSFRKSVNFKNVQKSDRIVMLYDQAYRLGNSFAMPIAKAAMIEIGGKKHTVYLNTDGYYYDKKGARVQGFLLNTPVRGARISSYFSKRRFHPILHRWKAHLGVDYAVRRGTPIHAAGDGKIIFAGRAGGYGNLIKIRHGAHYETRYAHMKAFRKGIKRGVYVKKGEVIGYVGTTGRSTGPHLHFEIRKNGVAINPLKLVKVTTKKLKGVAKREFLNLRDFYDENIEFHLKNKTKFKRHPHIDRVCYFDNIK